MYINEISVQQINWLASIIEWGKEFQSFITLTEKKKDLVRQFVCGFNNFVSWPLVMFVLGKKKKLS